MIATIVAAAAERHGSHPAFVAPDGARALGYADLDRTSTHLARALAAAGLRAGDVVALVLPVGLSFPLLYAAVAKVGAVTAGVNHRLTPHERGRVLARLAPRLTIVASGDAAGTDGHLTCELDPDAPDASDLPALPAAPPRALDGAIAICLTSGTTGTPKGAVFGPRQLRTITAVDTGGAWGGGGVGLLGTSFAHLGPMTKMPGTLMRGGTTHLLDGWRPSEVIERIVAAGVTGIGGVPTQIALLLDEPGFDDRVAATVRAVVMGGGPATPALVRRARAAFAAPVMTRYSCTEAGIGLGTRPEDPPEDAEETVGRAHDGVELAIRDGDRTCAPGEVGEVVLRSGAVMSGYLDDPAASAGAMTRDGFVRTGDLGLVDERGRLRLAGRIAQRYVRGGHNVHPSEVEAVLAEHPRVAAVAVVPRPDELWGEVGVAVVVPAGAPPTLAELRALARQRLASHKCPEALHLVDELPLTAAHKVDRRALADLVDPASDRPSVTVES